MLAVALGARPHLNHNHRPAPRRSAPHVSEHAPGEEPPCAVKMGTRPDVTLAPLFLFSRKVSDCLSVCLSVYVCPSLQDVPAPAGERTKLGLTARLPLLLAAVCTTHTFGPTARSESGGPLGRGRLTVAWPRQQSKRKAREQPQRQRDAMDLCSLARDDFRYKASPCPPLVLPGVGCKGRRDVTGVSGG